jgi:hypothetical protein
MIELVTESMTDDGKCDGIRQARGILDRLLDPRNRKAIVTSGTGGTGSLVIGSAAKNRVPSLNVASPLNFMSHRLHPESEVSALSVND